MILDSSNPPVYLPDKNQDSVLRLGIENRDLSDWIYAANELNVFHRHKKELNRTQGQCYHAEMERSAAVQAEFHDHLLQHLCQNPHLGYRRDGDKLVHEAEDVSFTIEEKKLWPASLWVAEDFCLLEEVDGDYILSAASVCSPSNWFLEENIGRSVDFIHDPVPGYAEVLSERVNKFLKGVREGRVILRYNWSIQQENELFWRDEESPSISLNRDSTSNLYWRIERQTFLRLPVTGAIVFGIRIFLHSFESLRSHEGFDAAVEQLLAQLPREQKQYKSLD